VAASSIISMGVWKVLNYEPRTCEWRLEVGIKKIVTFFKNIILFVSCIVCNHF
jgi:hypothetical protein